MDWTELSKKSRVLAMYLIIIDKDRCTGSGACVSICPVDVFELIENKAELVNAGDCVGCQSCIEVCEAEAITITEL